MDKIEDMLILELRIPRKLSDVSDCFIDEEHFTLNYDSRVFAQRFKARHSIIQRELKDRDYLLMLNS